MVYVYVGSMVALVALLFVVRKVRAARRAVRKSAVDRLRAGVVMILAYHGDFEGYAELRDLLDSASRHFDGQDDAETVASYYEEALKALAGGNVGEPVSTMQLEIAKSVARMVGFNEEPTSRARP